MFDGGLLREGFLLACLSAPHRNVYAVDEVAREASPKRLYPQEDVRKELLAVEELRQPCQCHRKEAKVAAAIRISLISKDCATP